MYQKHLNICNYSLSSMSEIIDIAKLSRINQITIPKAVRELLKLNPEDRLVFKKEDNKIVIEKA